MATATPIYSRDVNIKDFGAKGDGVTDDTTSIQSFFNYLKINGGVGHVSKGTYNITAPIELFNATTPFSVIGEGRDLVTFKRAAEIGTPWDFRSGAGLTFQGITFHGAFSTITGNASQGLSVFDCNNFT